MKVTEPAVPSLNHQSSHYRAALAIRAALRPTDPQRTSSAVRVYSPDGTLLETVTPDAWATRYPRRFASRRRWGWR